MAKAFDQIVEISVDDKSEDGGFDETRVDFDCR